jgi:hypothetical protein
LPLQQNNSLPASNLGHEKKKMNPVNGQTFNGVDKTGNKSKIQPQFANGLKRSKSLTSTDTLASGMAALGLTAESLDLGVFPAEIQENLDKAIKGE